MNSRPLSVLNQGFPDLTSDSLPFCFPRTFPFHSVYTYILNTNETQDICSLLIYQLVSSLPRHFWDLIFKILPHYCYHELIISLFLNQNFSGCRWYLKVHLVTDLCLHTFQFGFCFQHVIKIVVAKDKWFFLRAYLLYLSSLWHRTPQMVLWSTVQKLASHFPHGSLFRLWPPLFFLF